MGGDITLDSEPGRGSIFYLTLPLDCRVEPVDPAAAEPIAARDTMRVLLSVDDDPSVAPLLEKMLAGHGYRIVASRTRARPSATPVGCARRRSCSTSSCRAATAATSSVSSRAIPETSDIPVIVVSVVDPADVPDSPTAT